MKHDIIAAGFSSVSRKLALSLVLTLAAAGTALAEDGKIYPAAFCEGALVGNPPIISFSTAVTNTSPTYSAVLVCPTVKDNVFAASGLNEANLRYYKSGSSGFLADLYAYSTYATSSFLSSKSDFAGSGLKTLTWGAIGGYAEGFYEFFVVIPPSSESRKSSLISYRIDEND